MKSISRQATDSESKELDYLVSSNPGLKVEFERLQADARLAKDALPLVEAMQAKGAELPGYARARLQAKVKQTFGSKQEAESPDEDGKALAWGWKWFLGLAATVAVAALILVPIFFSPPKPQVQIAMLDVAGVTRGGDTNESTILLETLKGATVTNFSNLQELKSWEESWTAVARGYQIKVIYNRAAAEIRVLGRGRDREFTNTFPVDSDLHEALARAEVYINQQTAKSR
jgi:hypothetical protein